MKNDSAREGDEVVQLYLSGRGRGRPIRNLRGSNAFIFGAGETRDVEFTLGSGDVPKDK